MQLSQPLHEPENSSPKYFRSVARRVIWLRFDSIGVQLCRQRIRCPSARTINDAAFVRPATNQLEHLIVWRRFWNDAVSQVCTIETRDVAPRVAKMQLIDNVFTDALCCRRRQCHDRHIWQMSA